MTIQLSNLKSAASKSKRRIGRGHGSGRGTYAGRGMKGQRSRSGGKNKLLRRGVKQYLQQVPKLRGFTSPNKNIQTVDLQSIEKKFESGERITPKRLQQAGLASLRRGPIKILCSGAVKNKFIIQASRFSKAAKEAIEKAGGSVEIIGKKSNNKGAKKQ